jgi:hypothetical protein
MCELTPSSKAQEEEHKVCQEGTKIILRKKKGRDPLEF